jgi:hypothetical protein
MNDRGRLALGAAVAAAGVVLAAGAAAQTQVGAWMVSVNGAGHGRPVKTAILLAPDGASLIAACDSAGVDLLVSYLDVLPKQPELPVLWRLDGGAAHRQAWQEGGDHSSLSPGGPEADAAVLKQLARARILTITAVGRRSTFDLTGARQIANLIGDCPAVSTTAAPTSLSGAASAASADVR